MPDIVIPESVASRAASIYISDGADYTGDPYMPANGTEGEMFMGCWCEKCKHEQDNDCEILTASFIGIQPKEWVYSKNAPCCTKFEQM